jgi:hypothetical protein
LRPSTFSDDRHINRALQLAGGRIETMKLTKLKDKSSIALWFWLGHESGASERSGALIDAFGASLQARQVADHRVKLALGDAITSQEMFADDWHFAVLVRDGDQLRVHLDGGEQPVLTGTAGENGKTLVFGRGLQGKLDEITVWDRAIEPALIAALWQTSRIAEEHARHQAQRRQRAR